MKRSIFLLNFLLPILFHSNSIASKSDHAVIEKKLGEARKTRKVIKHGDTMMALLLDAGFSREKANFVLGLDILPKDHKIIAREQYLKLKAGDLAAIELFDPYHATTYLFWQEEGEAGAFRRKNRFRREIRTVGGAVIGSLIESIRQLTSSELVAYRFMDAFQLEGSSIKRLRKGAPFSLTYERLYAGELFIRDGEVLQASLEMEGEMRNKVFAQFEDGGVFISPQLFGKERPLYAPVAYISISSGFNPRRFHPIKKRRQPHWGTDFALAPGSPVFAAQKGRVSRLGRSRAGGHYVQIEHFNGYETTYNHLSSIAKNLKNGGSVQAGQTIGEVGCTGYCTKPHLHFQVKKGEKIVDPVKYIRAYPYHYKNKLKQFISRNLSPLNTNNL